MIFQLKNFYFSFRVIFLWKHIESIAPTVSNHLDLIASIAKSGFKKICLEFGLAIELQSK